MRAMMRSALIFAAVLVGAFVIMDLTTRMPIGEIASLSFSVVAVYSGLVSLVK